MKGIDDTTPGPRYLSQDTLSTQSLSSLITAGIFETDLDFANLKFYSATNETKFLLIEITIDIILGLLQLPYLEFLPIKVPNLDQKLLVDTNTVEFNLVSNEPLLNGN